MVPCSLLLLSTAATQAAVKHYRDDGVPVQTFEKDEIVGWIQGTARDPPQYPFKKFPDAYVATALKSHVDWRKDQGGKAVTTAKDQGPHGYCGTFARVAAAEGQYGLHSGMPKKNFSVEQLVDCIGWANDQFAYIVGPKGGFETAEDYPFNDTAYPDSKPPPCTYNKKKMIAKSNAFSNATAVPPGMEDQMAAFVHHNGPIQVGINANVFSGKDAITPDYFVTTQRCGEVSESIDHSVTLVGYGVSPTHGPFWMVKNSWTATWHDHGFVYLPRGINCANISQAGGDLFTMGDPSTYYV